MNKKWLIALIALATFLLCRYIHYFWAYLIVGVEEWNGMDHHLASSISVYSQILLVFLVTWLLYGKKLFTILGLDEQLMQGAAIGLLCTLPMFMGYAWMANGAISYSGELLHRDLVLAGFFEELLFRGFLFGVLFYYAGWGFIPAILIPSVYFGLGHLYQAGTVEDGMYIFLFTSLASAGFAWFYTCWKSLWPVIFLHGFMDLAWDLFMVDTDVTGNTLVNVFRFLTLGLMIAWSVRQLLRNPENGLKGKWWVNRTVA